MNTRPGADRQAGGWTLSWQWRVFKIYNNLRKPGGPPKFAEDALRRRILWVELRVGIHAKSILRLRISFAILRLSGTLTSSNSFLQPFHNAGARSAIAAIAAAILSFAALLFSVWRTRWRHGNLPGPRPSRRAPSPTLFGIHANRASGRRRNEHAGMWKFSETLTYNSPGLVTFI